MGLPVKDCSASRLRTKKIDCPVKITVKMIAKFPQFQVCNYKYNFANISDSGHKALLTPDIFSIVYCSSLFIF